MTLQEADKKLAELNDKIDRLSIERKEVLRKWNVAFMAEKPEKTVCEDRGKGERSHQLYLINGGFSVFVCHFDEIDMQQDLNSFYENLNIRMNVLNRCNHGEDELPEYQKNLVYAKATEIRDAYFENLLAVYQKEKNV